MRSWLFAAKLGQLKGIDCDLEAVAIGTILHDIGLTARMPGSNRFEVNGAAAALTFVKERKLSRHAMDERSASRACHAVTIISH